MSCIEMSEGQRVGEKDYDKERMTGRRTKIRRDEQRGGENDKDEERMTGIRTKMRREGQAPGRSGT